MQDLRVIGTEDGALLVSDDDGTRYRLPVDDVLQLKLRQVTPDPSIGQRLAPRDIQAYIRSGMSAEDVATITGAPLDHIQRFEGPVLAEREFIVTSALSVPVHTALETDPLATGSELRHGHPFAPRRPWRRERTLGQLEGLPRPAGSSSSRSPPTRSTTTPAGSSTRRRQALDPHEQRSRSRCRSRVTATGTLIPRLRAVHQEERSQDASRFDSGAFDLGETGRTRGPGTTRGRDAEHRASRRRTSPAR